MPAAGVPLSTPVVELSETPVGSVPLSLNVGAGLPEVVKVNEPVVPTLNVVLVLLVNDGADSARKLAVTVPVLLPPPTLKVQIAVGLALVHAFPENPDTVQSVLRSAVRVALVLLLIPESEQPLLVLVLVVPFHEQLPTFTLFVTVPGLDPVKLMVTVAVSVNAVCA